MTNKKKIYVFAGGLGIIVFLFLIGVFANRQLYQLKLLKEGIRAEAQVINKYHLKDIKGKIKKSYIELAIFEDTTLVAKQTKKAIETPTNINDKIDHLFDNLGSKTMPVGNYKTKSILINLTDFNAVKIGSTKTFVYLKGEVDKGMLLSKLE
jgi:hypothetical protein